MKEIENRFIVDLDKEEGKIYIIKKNKEGIKDYMNFTYSEWSELKACIRKLGI